MGSVCKVPLIPLQSPRQAPKPTALAEGTYCGYLLWGRCLGKYLIITIRQDVDIVFPASFTLDSSLLLPTSTNYHPSICTNNARYTYKHHSTQRQAPISDRYTESLQPELDTSINTMSGTVNIASSGEWQRILGSSTIVVTDCKSKSQSASICNYRIHLQYTYETLTIVYADWCGPCKMIAPTFESLSTKYSKPGKITFCKVNVDNQQSIAQAHGVSAMPTFLIFKSGSVIETIRGANPPSLTAAVEKAVKLAGTAAPGASFAKPGRTLGAGGSGSGRSAVPARRSASGGGSWTSFSPFNFINSLLAFFGLYFVSLLSVCLHARPERHHPVYHFTGGPSYANLLVV